MATKATQSNSPQYDTTQSTQIVRGTIVLSSNYGTAGSHGDPLDLSAGIQSQYPPVRVLIYEAPPAGTAPTGYQLGYALGSGPTNGQLTVMGGVATEYTQGSAYSAALLGAVIYYEAVFLLGQ